MDMYHVLFAKGWKWNKDKTAYLACKALILDCATGTECVHCGQEVIADSVSVSISKQDL